MNTGCFLILEKKKLVRKSIKTKKKKHRLFQESKNLFFAEKTDIISEKILIFYFKKLKGYFHLLTT